MCGVFLDLKMIIFGFHIIPCSCGSTYLIEDWMIGGQEPVSSPLGISMYPYDLVLYNSS